MDMTFFILDRASATATGRQSGLESLVRHKRYPVELGQSSRDV